jgi:DnaD/phage-associated family protein
VPRPFGGFQIASDPGIVIPRDFFTEVLPQIVEIAELHVTLTAFRLAAERGGIDKPLAESAIARDSALRSALRIDGSPNEPDRRIGIGLDLAVGRGSLLKVLSTVDGQAQAWYYVNTSENQAQVAAMGRGAVPPPKELWHGDNVPVVRPERPTVFRLYEQNIGLLTPLIAERLVDALETYPPEWIAEAISEAVNYNRRSWRYVNRILENWANTGRGSEGERYETHRRGDSRHLDPDQYKHGRYLERARGR